MKEEYYEALKHFRIGDTLTLVPHAQAQHLFNTDLNGKDCGSQEQVPDWAQEKRKITLIRDINKNSRGLLCEVGESYGGFWISPVYFLLSWDGPLKSW